MQKIGPRSFIMDGEIYDIPTKKAVHAVEGLLIVYKKLGKPKDISTEKGRLMMANIIDCWKKNFPQEYAHWIEKRKDHLSVERSVQDHAKGGGYQLMSFPQSVYKMIKAVFPEMKLNKKNLREIATNFEIFKLTKYKTGRKK